MNLNVIEALADQDATMLCFRGYEGVLVVHVGRRGHRIARVFDPLELRQRNAASLDLEILEMLDKLRRETP